MQNRFIRAAVMASLGAALSGCDLPFDLDLRDVANGFDTTEAARNVAQKPRPDARGVVSYSDYQVVIAKKSDTVSLMSKRLGLNAGEVARFNGLSPDTLLRAGEVIALPQPIEQLGGALSTPTAEGNPKALDINTIATTALDRASTKIGASKPVTAATKKDRPEPIRHRVAKGETIYTISRLYNVSTRSIADWNGLGTELNLREGQQILVPPTPKVQAPKPKPASLPGSKTPVVKPPSASKPLPVAVTAAATGAKAAATAIPKPPAIGQGTTKTSVSRVSRLARPVQGAIIRAYKPGKNEGIDIAASAGTQVRAADDGLIAAITKDTQGVEIVVIKHADNLLTVYTNIDELVIEKGDRVKRGQKIASVRTSDPSFLHFEVRKGLKSANPASYLP